MDILPYVHVQKIISAKKILSANVIQCNERRTDFDLNIARKIFLVVSFHMVALMNQRHI